VALLQAIDIHKSYAVNDTRLQILRGVQLEVEQGELVALMGPSGSGKSTLLNILGTLDKPDQGRVLVGGVDMVHLGDDALSDFRNRNIGFVFQFHHLLPELTVWENLELPLWLGSNSAAADTTYIRELLTLTGLMDRRHHYPSQLSGGERQRVAVLRALVKRPGIVLADEPTGNLDAANGAILMKLIRQLQKDHGQTFLIATHSEPLAESADRRLFLSEGVVKLSAEVDGSGPKG